LGIKTLPTARPLTQPPLRNVALEFSGTPVSYFSVNDFLNLARELRTTPE
jgi:hypothetical protein